MTIAFKYVRVEIPLTVEVSCDEPVRIEEFSGITETKTVFTKKELFKFEVCDSVLGTRTDVV